MRIEHIIFLIHPGCYEGLGAAEIRRDDLQVFADRERAVKGRWIAEMEARGRGTMLVQLGGPTDLRDRGAACFGEAGVFYPSSEFAGELAGYYRALAEEFWAHCAAHELTVDVTRVTSELWGESFEGCVAGYGGGVRGIPWAEGPATDAI